MSSDCFMILSANLQWTLKFEYISCRTLVERQKKGEKGLYRFLSPLPPIDPSSIIHHPSFIPFHAVPAQKHPLRFFPVPSVYPRDMRHCALKPVKPVTHVLVLPCTAHSTPDLIHGWLFTACCDDAAKFAHGGNS